MTKRSTTDKPERIFKPHYHDDQVEHEYCCGETLINVDSYLRGHCTECVYNSKGWCKLNMKWAHLFLKDGYHGECRPVLKGENEE